MRLTEEYGDLVSRDLRNHTPDNRTATIRYRAPWTDATIVAEGSVDLVLSQAVLEHVDDLPSTYAAIRRWLRPGALASNVIDFRSHGLTAGWDGHLQYSPSLWRIVRGRRPYLLNRAGPSDHLRFAMEAGLGVVVARRYLQAPTLARAKTDDKFSDWTDEDRETTTMYLLLKRPA